MEGKENADARRAELGEYLADQVDRETGWAGRSTDWFLQNLVNTVDTSDGTFGLTLNVEGAVITGTLISAREYFAELGKVFEASIKDKDVAREWREAIASNGEPTPGDEQMPRQYLHLKGARVVTGGTFSPREGALWRGKIRSVSGFSLGILTPN